MDQVRRVMQYPSIASLAAVVSAVVTALSLPALAGAKLPVTKNHSIVPNQSVGGVTLGMTKAQAVARWGSKPRCVPPDNGVQQCYWEPPGTLGDGGRIQVRRGRIIVVGVSISSTMKPSEVRALSRFKTAKGIHIGSPKSAAQRAYPGLQVPPGEAGSPFLRSCNVNCTWFGGLSTKIERISVALRSPLGYR